MSGRFSFLVMLCMVSTLVAWGLVDDSSTMWPYTTAAIIVALWGVCMVEEGR